MTTAAYDIIHKYVPTFSRRHAGRIVKDTTEFMSIDYGDVIKLGTRHFLVTKNITERRFGLEDPKYWVKRCKELETGQPKILKLEFYEKFDVQLGTIRSTCFRSPQKESRILKLVHGDMRYMQGETIHDTAGNKVRILDIIYGTELDIALDRIDLDHEAYFHTLFPEFLVHYLGIVRAIEHLHEYGEQHGDIRRDHVLIESETKAWRWIDFDYAYEQRQNPFALDIFGLGSIFLLLVGQREMTTTTLAAAPPERAVTINSDDMALAMPNRIANLQKIYPYIPRCINDVCMHFSSGNTVFYSSVSELVSDLLTCFHSLPLCNSIQKRYKQL